MRKDTFLFIVGVLIYLVPFLGVPEKWKSAMLFVLGTSVVLGAVSCRLATRKRERNESEVFFEENQPMSEGIKEENIEVIDA